MHLPLGWGSRALPNWFLHLWFLLSSLVYRLFILREHTSDHISPHKAPSAAQLRLPGKSEQTPLLHTYQALPVST